MIHSEVAPRRGTSLEARVPDPATQTPLRLGEIQVTTNRTSFYILIAAAFIITAISFRTYFKYADYNLDDYYTFEFAPAGTSITEAASATTHFLYRKQARYQPVRLYVFTFFTHVFGEDASPYYNFALHLANILLLFLLLGKFRIGGVFSLISVLYFAVFGRFRYMDASCAMVGGSGLNLFFILLSFLFLIKALEADPARPLGRYFFLGVSVLAYTALVFSYEVAVPLFAPLFVVFYLFNRAGGKKGPLGPLMTRRSLYLLLYLVPLAVYIVFFRLLVKVTYSGAQIKWSLDILSRWLAYVKYTLIPPFQTHGLITVEFVMLIIYFGVLILAMRRPSEPGTSLSEKKKAGLKLLLFSVVFYPSTVVVFTLNHWLTPRSVMQHHTYIMTAAGGILLASIFYNLGWFLAPRPRRLYLTALVVLLFPLLLISAEHSFVRHYKDDSSRALKIRNLRRGLQSAISDINGTDAVLLKNFFFPFYDISSMDGALLSWFDFRKVIRTGRSIQTVRDGVIVFKGPLHRYKKPVVQRVKNNHARIFFMNLDDGTPMPYHYFIDFERGANLYQTVHVKDDWKEGEARDPRVLEAILANEGQNRYLGIWFRGRSELEGFMRGLDTLEVNDEPVPRESITLKGDHLIIDIGDTTERIRYYFLKIRSRDEGFRQGIRLIALMKKDL